MKINDTLYAFQPKKSEKIKKKLNDFKVEKNRKGLGLGEPIPKFSQTLRFSILYGNKTAKSPQSVETYAQIKKKC